MAGPRKRPRGQTTGGRAGGLEHDDPHTEPITESGAPRMDSLGPDQPRPGSPADRPGPETVRGRILDYLLEHLPKLDGCRVAEIGSRPTQPDEWRRVANLFDPLEVVGFDLLDGPGVDVVHDFDSGPWDLEAGGFAGAVCSEVLEHVKRPAEFLRNVGALLEPEGLLVVTTLFAFPWHGYPCDYWRFTEDGLRLVFESAGFDVLETRSAGMVTFELSDHGEPSQTKVAPLHTFGLAAKRAPSWSLGA